MLSAFQECLWVRRESEDLCRRLGFYSETLECETVEAALQEAGSQVVRSEAHQSEYAEFYELHDGRCARYLMRMEKLMRGESLVVDRFGRELYKTVLGIYSWQIYQMMGKISYHAYLLKKPL